MDFKRTSGENEPATLMQITAWIKNIAFFD